MSENQFAKVLQRAREGDEEAQTQLYFEYGPHIRRVIKHRLRDMKIGWAVAPDDVFDSVFVRLWQQGSKLNVQDAEHLLKYLSKAARNKIQEVLRKMARVKTSADEPPGESLAKNATDESEDLEFSEELARVCETLTGRERLVCLLRNSGHTWSEIGLRLHISSEAARKAHDRSETRIREELLET
jgi:RNA polymerase sigma factor (sigma-70 family)